MPAATAPIAVFGDLDAGLWGIVVGGEQPHAAVAGLTDADVALLPVDLDQSDDDLWEVTGPGFALRIERADATTSTADSDGSLEPCRVSGAVTLDDVEREFDVGGVRSAALSLDKLDSLRLLGSWFPAGHEVALLATRPKGAKGQDRDVIAAIALGEEHPLVLDPRLSTTYDHDGDARRVGVELWLGDDDSEESEQWSRRVAGIATGSNVVGATPGAAVSARALECVSRGELGAGVYVLLTSV
jgi:hypothetical protein